MTTRPFVVIPARRLQTGALIGVARRDAGLTQAALAKRVGTTQSAVARWESGKETPRLDTLDRVLRSCGVEFDVRLRRHDDVDRAQLRWNLARTPLERLQGLTNTSRLLATARRIG